MWLRGLNVVIQAPEPVLVRFLGDRRLILGVLRLEACLLPALPGDDGVIGGRESFLFANGGNPSIHGLFVNLLKPI